jgi:hypothetical protein
LVSQIEQLSLIYYSRDSADCSCAASPAELLLN